MSDLFGNPIIPSKPAKTKSGSLKSNPLIPYYGTTEGERCKTCKHLVRKAYAKVYYKCALRGNVDKASIASDHKVNWPACGKYEPNDKNNHTG